MCWALGARLGPQALSWGWEGVVSLLQARIGTWPHEHQHPRSASSTISLGLDLEWGGSLRGQILAVVTPAACNRHTQVRGEPRTALASSSPGTRPDVKGNESHGLPRVQRPIWGPSASPSPQTAQMIEAYICFGVFFLQML